MTRHADPVRNKIRRSAATARVAGPDRRRRGVVLVIVLVVVSVLILAAFTFTNLMVTHRGSAQLSGRQLQARALVESGAESVRMFLLQDEATRVESGGLFDNPIYFQGVQVLVDPDPAYSGNFTVLAPNLDEFGGLAGLRYGLEDESTRLNLNALMLADKAIPNGGRTLLMALPGMTEDIADAIMDWIDEDDDPRDYGVESQYYQDLEPPYACKNGPLDTVEELLLVRGVTPQLLFGLDANRNNNVDSHELGNSMLMSTTATSSSSLIDPAVDRGWAPLLTLYSMEKNVNAEGLPRIYLNNEDLESLHQQLSEIFPAEWTTFIVAYRQNGALEGDDDTEAETLVTGELDLSQPATTTISQVLELVDKKVRLTYAGDSEPTVLASPFTTEIGAMMLYMPTLMDNVSTNPSPVIPGRININQAPRDILMGIPGLEEETVDMILQERQVESDDDSLLANMQHETWLLTAGLISLEQMRQLVPFVTAGGDVYRAQIVGYFEDGSASSRAEVVFDATGPSPRILSWRDISHLGRGYPLDVLGLRNIGIQ